jgi:4-amino-4-deoxy-L-arabinose transferase-like glycosyltransferase
MVKPGSPGIVRPFIRSDLLPVAALLLLGSAAFVHLTALPAFEDEGSQLRWVWRAIEAGEWLLPLNEGKPLEAWPMVPLVQLGFAPPLVVTRGLHVLAGMIAAVLTWRLALAMLERPAAFASGVLFAVCPFAVYLQRLALSDMFLCAAGTWVLGNSLALVQSPAWSRAAVLGISLVLAALCKMPIGLVFLASTPLALLLMPVGERQRMLLQPAALAKLLVAHAPVAVLALVVAITAVIRLRHGHSPGFGLQDLAGIGLGNNQDMGAGAGVSRPNLIVELTTQLSWPVTVIALIGLVAGALFADWRVRWLIAIGMLPMLGIGLLVHFWYSRYLLFTLPPLIIAAVSGWHALALRCGRLRTPVEVAVLLVCAGLMSWQATRLILDPATARWSPLDRFQYFEGWGSGYGFQEAAKFVLTASDAPRMIYALDGHSAYQLRNYLPPSWNSRIEPIYYGDGGRYLPTDEARLRNLLEHTPAWIVIPVQLLDGYLDSTFHRRDLASLVELQRIATFEKPGAHVQLALYRVTRR